AAGSGARVQPRAWDLAHHGSGARQVDGRHRARRAGGRGMRRCVCVGLLLSLSACPQAATTSPDEATTTAAASDEPPVIPSKPANKAAGDEIDATIPIVGGDAIELSSLRGRPVLLEISASWELGFAEAHAV